MDGWGRAPLARLTVTCEVPPTHSSIKVAVNDEDGVTVMTNVFSVACCGRVILKVPAVILKAFFNASSDVSVSMTRSLMKVSLIWVVPLGNTMGFGPGFWNVYVVLLCMPVTD